MKKIIFTLLTLFIIGAGILTIAFSKENKLINEITFTSVSLENLDDGIYSGSYKTNFIIVEVSVYVKAHAIEKIDLIKHQNGKGQQAEKIIEQIITAQTTDVDTISGATASSKVIRKAIESALLSAGSKGD